MYDRYAEDNGFSKAIDDDVKEIKEESSYCSSIKDEFFV